VLLWATAFKKTKQPQRTSEQDLERVAEKTSAFLREKKV
jgi:hypothetical protein